MNFFLFNFISAFPSVQLLNQNHNTIMFGSCRGALRRVIDFDLSKRKTLCIKQNESRISNGSFGK